MSPTGRKFGGGNSTKPVPLPRKNRPPEGSEGKREFHPPPPLVHTSKPAVVPRRGVTSPNRPTQSLSTHLISNHQTPAL